MMREKLSTKVISRFNLKAWIWIKEKLSLCYNTQKNLKFIDCSKCSNVLLWIFRYFINVNSIINKLMFLPFALKDIDKIWSKKPKKSHAKLKILAFKKNIILELRRSKVWNDTQIFLSLISYKYFHVFNFILKLWNLWKCQNIDKLILYKSQQTLSFEFHNISHCNINVERARFYSWCNSYISPNTSYMDNCLYTVQSIKNTKVHTNNKIFYLLKYPQSCILCNIPQWQHNSSIGITKSFISKNIL